MTEALDEGSADDASGPALIGNHAVRLEPPDLICIAPQGDVTEADMRALADHLRALSTGRPYVLLLADLSAMLEIGPDARRFTLSARSSPYRGMAFHGASFPARIAATLVLGAARMLGKMGQNPIRFFATEAQARAWLDERRRVITGAQPR